MGPLPTVADALAERARAEVLLHARPASLVDAGEADALSVGGSEGAARRGLGLATPTLLLVVVLAVAIAGQGAYYPGVQALVALGLAAAVVASVRTARWSQADLRRAPIPFCAALAGWALASAALHGDPWDAGGYVALLAGVATVVVLCGRAPREQREALVQALLVLATLAAVSGWAGVAWRIEPWALEHDGLWRAETTLTYANAAAGLLVPVALLALARLAVRLRSPIGAMAACLLLVGAGATLSRGGALAMAAGMVVLAGLLGFRRLLSAGGPPVLGAAIALAGLAPSMPAGSQPRPALAGLALVAGLAAAAGLSRVSSRTLAVLVISSAVAGSLALTATDVADGVLEPIGESRLSTAAPNRGEAARAALRLVGERPLTGVGPGEASLAWTGPDGQTLVARYAHNEYLQVLAELGAVGLALLIALIATVVVSLWRARAWAPSPGTWAGIVAALVAVAVHSAFDFLWHLPAILLVTGALVGVTSRGTEAAIAAQSPSRNHRSERRCIQMNEHEPCCPPHWRGRIPAKLGSCPRCMRASLLLTLAAWTAFGVGNALVAHPAVVGLTIIVAGAFTLLFLAHLGAFFTRAAGMWRAGASAGHGRLGEQTGQSRRSFMAAATALLAGLLFAPLFRLFGSESVAQQSPPLGTCSCDARTREPKQKCDCSCNAADPPPPARACTQAIVGKKEGKAETETKGVCKGQQEGCEKQGEKDRECTITQEWECNFRTPLDQTPQWLRVKRKDSCPKLQDRETSANGTCRGSDPDCPVGKECEKRQNWRCTGVGWDQGEVTKDTCVEAVLKAREKKK